MTRERPGDAFFSCISCFGKVRPRLALSQADIFIFEAIWRDWIEVSTRLQFEVEVSEGYYCWYCWLIGKLLVLSRR